MTAADLLHFALNCNLHIVRVKHLERLASLHGVSFLDVRRAARDAGVITLKLTETYIGRVGYETRLAMFAESFEVHIQKQSDPELLLDDTF